MRKNSLGYNLVEVLIVMSIIGVLVGFLLQASQKVRQKAKLSRTQALMDSVSAALKMYNQDFGAFPPDSVTGGTSSEALYCYLGATFVMGQNSSVYAGPYMKFKGDELVDSGNLSVCDYDGDGGLDDSNEIVDPWEDPLHYDSTTPANNTNTFDLYSEGPDEVDNNGSGDDINNWE